ncbi:hypothetical protein JOM56_004458 [Amanita muscaria]
MNIPGPQISFSPIFQALEQCETTISDLIVAMLTEARFKKNPLTAGLLDRSGDIIYALLNHKKVPRQAQICAGETLHSVYAAEIDNLVDVGSEWHFSAIRAVPQDVDDFHIEELAADIDMKAPMLSALLEVLLSARKRSKCRSSSEAVSAPLASATSNPEDDEVLLEGQLRTPSSPDEQRAQKHKQKEKILSIKKAVVTSILMQSTNRKANNLQGIIGIFLYSCCTPERVVNALARIGISISMNAILLAIKSLSNEACRSLRALGQTLLAGYAYNNFDVNLKASVPVSENPFESLKHLTSGLLIPLEHGVNREDLRCSAELWAKSRFNPDNRDMPPESKTYRDLLTLHPEPSESGSSLTRRERFTKFLLLRDLCTHSAQYFCQFLGYLDSPEEVEAIPVIKTVIQPMFSMEANNSTTSGNLQAIDKLLEQGGIYDPDEIEEASYSPDIDISDYVVLFHGDLGTGVRIKTAQEYRSIEETPYHRKQHVIFVPGLFHTKMAATDALHRILVKPELARKDKTNLMGDITVLRPKETGIMSSKPGFRRMHQVINHAGTSRRLDCWRVLALRRNSTHDTLEKLAESEPMFYELEEIAEQIVNEFCSIEDLSLERLKPESERDQVFENAQIINSYLALYEELSYAMNFGDIGRVETCLVTWIPLFKATGKHIYATHLEQFLLDMHFKYPEGLRRAIRYNILINPTGKAGKFRAADWLVELHNLDIKVNHGGQGPNYTVKRIIEESSLIGTYKNAHEAIHLTHSCQDEQQFILFQTCWTKDMG